MKGCKKRMKKGVKTKVDDWGWKRKGVKTRTYMYSSKYEEGRRTRDGLIRRKNDQDYNNLQTYPS